MATTFTVLSLGAWAALDPTEGGTIADNAASLAGQTFGSADDPLANHAALLSPGDYSGGDAAAYDTNNAIANDTFRIDGGALQTFDAVVAYTATITYADGTTASLTRVGVMQDTAGQLYLVPSQTYDGDQAVLEAKPIQSITLGSYVPSGEPDGGWNMIADRDPGDGIVTLDGIVQGTDGDDSIGAGYVDGGGDQIDGTDGDADTVRGGLGNDTIASGAGADSVQAGAGDDIVDLGVGNDTLGNVNDWNTEEGNDSVHGGDGNDLLIGGGGNDTLHGDAGDDTISGAWGADLLYGGAGNDMFFVSDGQQTDTVDGGTETDTLYLWNYTQASGVGVSYSGSGTGSWSYNANDYGVFTSIEVIWGTEYGDTVNAAADAAGTRVYGNGGADSVLGGSGADTLDGGTGNDTLSGGAGGDLLTGGSGNDSLSGDADADQFQIGSADGTDTLAGGETGIDYDMVTFSGGSGGVSVTYTGAETGTYSVSGGGSGVFSQIEAISGTAAADTLDAGASTAGATLIGGAGNDVLTGGSGNDHFNGDDGDDTETGGLGNDTLNGDAGNDVLDGGAGDDWLLGGSGNNTLTGGDGNDYFNGYSGANLVSGGAGADTILVGDGADTLDGGTGADSISAGSGSDRIVLTAGFGNDTIAAGEVDDAAGDTLDGSALASGTTLTMTGPESGTLSDADSLASFSEVERVLLGTGADSVDATGATGGVNVDAGAGNDTLTGSAGHDTFGGGEGDDVMAAGAGNDALTGGGGNDTLHGGTGNDTIAAGDGDDMATGGDGADSLGGGDGNDTLLGEAGNDTLAGDAGNDVLRGGTGNDTLGLGLGNDTLVLADGDGADLVQDFDTTIDPGSQQTRDQLDTSALTTLSGAPVTVKDVTLSDDGLGNTVLTFPHGESLTLVGVPLAQLSATKVQSLHAMGIPCFVAGGLIDTPGGPVAVQDLRPGDLVRVRDGPPLPVLWTASRHVAAAEMRQDPRLLPVEIRAGAFGNPRPVRLSAQHCVLVPEGGGRLVRTRHLAESGWGGARVMAGKAGCSYHHLLLPRHALVHVNGLWAESFWPGPVGHAGLDAAAGLSLMRSFPALVPGLLGLRPVDLAYSPRACETLPRRHVTRKACLAWASLLHPAGPATAG